MAEQPVPDVMARLSAYLTQVSIIYGPDSGAWVFSVPENSLLTEEERERYRAEQQEAAKVRIKEREAVDGRARELFLSCLTDKQREQYGNENGFKVVGSSRGRYYIDCTHLTYNVTRIRKLKPAERLCATPPGVGSRFDSYLAQKLLLESDEKAFLAVANVDR